ncbi:hypothetical protein [Microbacterium sp. gxy059]|uniref:hypothetical protein n=1 Tax=Microbacterium sp. gxy059 TaxID=2957199 RepID=UPI003D992ED3
MTKKKPLRERIREAGGFYHWFNSRLIRFAGPPQVGPYGPDVPPPCGRCGQAKSAHEETADGALRCPEGAPTDAA